MRLTLGSYSGHYIKIVAEFKKYGSSKKNGNKNKILLRDIISAEDGEYLADHVWITCNNILNNQHFSNGDKIFIIAKVCSYKKGYLGRNIDLILKTNNASYDYHLVDAKVAITEKTFLKNKSYLETLTERKKYIIEKKEETIKFKEEADRLIEMVENDKLTFEDNPILQTSQFSTIEPNFENKFYKIPILYALVETIKKRKIINAIKIFKTNYKNIKEYHQNKFKIKEINTCIINGYGNLRLAKQKLENIEKLETEINEQLKITKNNLAPIKNVMWEQAPEYIPMNQTKKLVLKKDINH